MSEHSFNFSATAGHEEILKAFMSEHLPHQIRPAAEQIENMVKKLLETIPFENEFAHREMALCGAFAVRE